MKTLITARTTAISSRSKATARPMAPVFQILAAEETPETLSLSLRIALPPPIKPIPVMIPFASGKQWFKHIDDIAFPGGVGSQGALAVKLVNGYSVDHGQGECVDQPGSIVREYVRSQ